MCVCVCETKALRRCNKRLTTLSERVAVASDVVDATYSPAAFTCMRHSRYTAKTLPL